MPQPSFDMGTEKEAVAIARECVRAACDALVLLTKGDHSSADTALKRAMVAAHTARHALVPALRPTASMAQGSIA